MYQKPCLKSLLTLTVLAGCFAINLPFGVEWFYGNLSTYTNSYFRYHIGDSAYDLSPNWLLPGFFISFVPGLSVADLLGSHFDLRLIQLICIVLYNLGVTLTYFTVQHSVGLTLITFMVIGGFTCGIANVISLKYAAQVLPTRAGLATGIVTTALGTGPIAYNYIITSYINPDNLTPDVHTANENFFAQASLLSHVPGLFVVIGVVGMVIDLLGYILELSPFFILNKLDDDRLTCDCDANEQTGIATKTSEHRKSSQTSDVDSAIYLSDIDAPASKSIEKIDDIKPTEVLRSRSLYVLWICGCVLTYCIILNLNYYKDFGQLWIKDDRFLASVGSLSAVSNSVCRIPSGMLVDKIGPKNAIITAMSLNTILMPFWFISARINRWLYLIFCQVLITVQASLFILFPASALRYYGPKYFATNYSLVMAANALTCLACPALFLFLQENYGWFSLVFIGGISSVFALVFVMLFMKNDTM